MKVGILTYHKSINYGAFLQCYSLVQALNKIPGIDAEVIDYDSRKADIHYKLKVIQKSVQSMSFKPYKQFKAFKGVWEKLPLSKESCITDSIKEFTNYIKEIGYDIIIVGSDEVWKLDGFRGFPNAYWLLGDLNCIKISYAASSRSSADVLNEENLKILEKAISDFSYIGVRDKKTFNMIKDISKRNDINYTCDPTFLLEIDINRNRGRRILKEKLGIHEDEKIIGIMTQDNNICRLIKNKYGKEYKIVSIYHPLKSADYYLADINPFEWIDIISAFDLFVTSFFHGTIFSMKTDTPFICIDTYSKEATASKIGDLLEQCNMLDRLLFVKELNEEQGVDKLYKKIDKVIENPEFDKIHSAIITQQSKYKSFLDNFNLIVKGVNEK